MSETFTKLFSSIIGSSVWAESDQTRLVWVTMLAMADRNGYVGASALGLAQFARVPLESVKRALAVFLAPDTESRSKEYEGRRIEEADRGWNILNHNRFRDMRDEEVRREYERDRKREQRAKTASKPVKRRPIPSQSVHQCLPQSAHAEAEAEADTEEACLLSGGSTEGADQDVRPGDRLLSPTEQEDLRRFRANLRTNADDRVYGERHP